jgi:thiol-disulfide isomerase/thioredoxin
MRTVLPFALALAIALPALHAQEEPTKPSKPAAARPGGDRFTVPEGADVAELMEFLEKLLSTRATSAEQQRRMRVAMGDAARAILRQEKDTKSEAYLLAKTIDLNGDVRSLISATPEERKEFCDQVQKLLEHKKVGRMQLGLAQSVVGILEDDDDKSAAIAAYKQFGEALAKSSDDGVARQGKTLIGAARRLELPGKTFELAGAKVDGTKFNISDLKGKVVLVDFWATWCGPCVAEIPNMKRMYKQYHDKGFEIVGLSIDKDREDLDGFLKKRELPWIILHDDENEGDHPATVDYGVFGIPTMILVGKDGKVLDINARGEKLQELLEKQFESDPNAEKKEESDK